MPIFSALPPGWWRARRYHIIAPLVALAVVAVIGKTTHLIEQLEDLTINLRFTVRAPFDQKADPRLVLVGIDQKSIDHTGSWPWPRNIEADFLNTIANAQVNPRVVIFDILFTDDYDKFGNLKKSNSGVSLDEALGDATGQLPVITGALVLAPELKSEVEAQAQKTTLDELALPSMTLSFPNVKGDVTTITGSNTAIFPVPPIRKQSLFGFVNDEADPIDHVRHTIPLIVHVRDKVYPSLALQTLCQMLGVDADKVQIDLPGRTVKLTNSSHKSWTIPIGPRGEFSINYRSESSFRAVSFITLLSALANHVANGTPIPDEGDIANDVLVVGQTATGLTDLGPTPLQANSPLVYTHLNVINNILKGDYLSFVPLFWVVVGWSLVTWPTILRLKDAPLGEAVLVPIALVIGYVVIAFAIFGFWSIQIALAWPVLSYAAVNFGGVVLRWREEAKGRQQIKGVFSQMLSPEVMNHLLKHPENIQLGGVDRPTTILFSDIRDYTKFSEGKTAEEVLDQLNTYFERMVPCITEKKGTVHKFIGDAVMAAWGDIADTSMGSEQDARNAVSSAVLMRVRLQILNAERKELGLTPIRIGVGLNHGIVQAGILGSTGRKEFTMIGDEVNVASRLEGITKEFRTDLAISESVKQLLGDTFLVRRLGFIQLKGKTQATLVFEVLAEKPDLANVKLSPEGVVLYETAFDHFLARRFAEAEAAFVEFQKDYPDDFCAKNYLDASREFKVTPPPPEWDGRIVMTTK